LTRLAVRRRRFLGIVACGAIALLLLEVALVSFLDTGVGPWAGIDYQMYMEAAYRFQHGDGYFLPHQLAGPYRIQLGDVLYPPIALWLFVPFMSLPAYLWWVIPISVTLAVVYRLRPAPWTWPLLALCVAWPTTSVKLFTGNPVMWAMMAMALGVLFRWPSVFVAVKASLFPFALFGIWHRSWWKAAGVFALLSLPFGTLWLDWLRSLLNSTGGGLAYSVMEVPMLLFPLIAWAGSLQRPYLHDRWRAGIGAHRAGAARLRPRPLVGMRARRDAGQHEHLGHARVLLGAGDRAPDRD
jgi:hypothetical protein